MKIGAAWKGRGEDLSCEIRWPGTKQKFRLIKQDDRNLWTAQSMDGQEIAAKCAETTDKIGQKMLACTIDTENSRVMCVIYENRTKQRPSHPDYVIVWGGEQGDKDTVPFREYGVKE